MNTYYQWQPSPTLLARVAIVGNEIKAIKKEKVKHKWGSHFLTDEQEAALELSKKEGWLKVEAMAGSGKTTMLNVISTLGLSNKKCLYIAFNKAIVAEAERVFPRNVTCKTTHSLAGANVVAWRGKQYGDGKFDAARIGGLNGQFISRQYGINEGFSSEILRKKDSSFSNIDMSYLALAAIERFCNTADKEITSKHAHDERVATLILKSVTESDPEQKKALDESIKELRSAAARIANRIWERMIDPEGSARITHNIYLKVWALGNPDLSRFDVILFDEAQDANPLMLDVVLRQKTKNIFVGDRYQQIYSWNGAVNAMSHIKTDNVARISQSFRFGKKIADLASEVLRYAYGNNKIAVRGFDRIESSIHRLSEYDAYIARTNTCLINALIDEISNNPNKIIAIEGGIRTLIDLLNDARSLINGHEVSKGDLSAFCSWDEVVKHSNTDAGASLRPLVKLIDDYQIDPLIGMLSGCRSTNDTRSADVVFTTAHKSKGKEYQRVKLAPDFKTIEPLMNTEEANLLYVAITRATHALDISECCAIDKIINGD